MSYQLLEQYIGKLVQFSDSELKTFSQAFYPQNVSKKEFLLRRGTVCRFEAFVVEGCFRLYSADHVGNENVLYFAVKNWWITDVDSFTNQTIAQLSIQALENSEVLIIDKTDKERLYDEMPKVERLFRIMTQKTLVALQYRLIRDHNLTVEERYRHFVTTYPEIAQKLNNLQIAAYLGVTHEFVSKIKKKISLKR